jgi:hypothetical protein
MIFTDVIVISQQDEIDMPVIQMAVIFWGFKPGSTGLL